MNKLVLVWLGSIALLTGCTTPDDAAGPVVNTDEAMIFLEPGLRPEVLLFPDYLLMEDFELNQHGIIPQSTLVGAGMKTIMSFKQTMRLFNDALAANEWTIDKVEMEKQAFRTLASRSSASIEIRAVQGEGATEIFILYQPEPVADSVKNY